jgi:nucleotide-binding universal stress UspA family protein
MTYRKILVALDLSPFADSVFVRAGAIAQSQGAELVLLHCSPLPELYNANSLNYLDGTPNWTIDLQLAEESQRRNAKEAEALIRRFEQKAAALDLKPSHALRFDNPGRGICQAIQELEVDLVVIGRRGLSRLNEFLLGSVSSYVVHHATCDVLVVQHQSST